ncbi:MAG: alpha/beta-hydrolase family protein, partial [Acidimicrobiia bacterium]|nr:alpha/beta-hydrolase family protein [Acidimicrobiia bacterium]
EYKDLSAEHRKKLRAVIVDHDNDPIAQMSFRWAVKRPPWLDGSERGRDVPEGMHWYPLVTFVQVMVDAMNAMRTVPGEFKSFGHDYRGDTAPFVHAAYQLDDVTDAQMEKVVDTLRQLELERGERIKTAKAQATEAGDTVKRTRRPKRAKPGIYLRDRTPMDADEPAIEITPGDAPGDIQ